jgi:regulation of enolase protein 1 (concanavalin A-like superfamily)
VTPPSSPYRIQPKTIMRSPKKSDGSAPAIQGLFRAENFVLRDIFYRQCQAIVLILSMLVGSALAAVDIPDVSWTERSDWVNVKTDVSPQAVGDGVVDDTAAIQAAFNLISNHDTDMANAAGRRVVYFPPGTYKISTTLEMHKTHGATIVGHGRSSVLIWYGGTGGKMLWQESMVAVQFDGLAFEGRGIAAHGIYDSSDAGNQQGTGGQFETGGRYENLAFRNFSDVALYFPNDNNMAAADGMIKNCLFQSCGVGICTKLANVWTWSIEGCEFYDCGRGYKAWFGQAYVRSCHFERSLVADITAEGPGPVSSVNRCTSIGSHRFFWNAKDIWLDAGNQSIRDCQVTGWTALDGAIRTYGTQTIADCVFTDPPNDHPAISVVDGRNTDNSIVLGNNSPANIFNGCANLRVDTIPAGARTRTLSSPNTHFLKQTAVASGTIFDAKTQFGAAANGTADDTAAAQACLNAARDAGGNAVAYFPAGDYRITAQLIVNGGNYRVEGSGAWTRFRWDGGTAPSMLKVDNPQGIAFRWLNFVIDGGNGLGIANVAIHTSSSSTSSATYEQIWTWDYADLGLRGFLFDNMAAGSRAHIEFLSGYPVIRNCSRAKLLFNYAGSTTQKSIRVEGTSQRDGFLGALTMEGSLEVRDNQNIVVESFYCEATDKFLQAWGSGSIPGYITIGTDGPYWTNWSRWHGANNPPLTDLARRDMMTVNNYNGRIYKGNSITESHNPLGAATVRHTGTNPLDIIFLGDEIRVGTDPVQDWDWQLGASCRKIFVGRKINVNFTNSNLPNEIPAGGLASIAAAWDDLRLLGQYDLDWNYPNRFDTPPIPLPSDTTNAQTGTITARGENSGGGEGKAQAFDNNANSKWLDNVAPNGTGNFSWIQYVYPGSETQVVTRFSITSANDVPGRDPADFRIYGIDGGGTLTLLDTRTNQTFSDRFVKNAYSISNSTAYRGYRLEITRISDPNAGMLQLSEIEFIKLPIPNGPLGYTYCANEYQSVTFNQTVDVAFGANGIFRYLNGQTGPIQFDSTTFGEGLLPGIPKYGFYRVIASAPNSVSSVAGPTTVSQGQTVAVTLNYGALTACDIIVDFKQWSGNFDTYSSTRTAVPGGTGSITVNVPVGLTTPAGSGYAYFAYEVPTGGSWENRVAESLQTGITVQAVLPAAPSALISAVAANGRISLSWTDNSSNETGFLIERKTGAGGTYAQVATVGPNVTTYSEGGLVPGTQYYYRVRATSGSGSSGFTAEANSTTLAQAPYGGAPRSLPGTVEAEDFDTGGEGVAYHDNQAGNTSGASRPGEDVDTEGASDTGGGLDVGYIENGEWLEYTVNVTAGVYNLTFRVASAVGGGQIRALLDGVDLGTVVVASTGGWQTWADVTLSGKTLAGGNSKILRLEFTGGLNLNKTIISSTLPSPWLTADIGPVGLSGSGAWAAGSYTLKGSGLGISGTSDQFRYVYQTMTGDGSITARLSSQSGTLATALAGVMVRESTAANSRFAMVARSGSGATNMRATRRTTTGGVTASTTSTSQTPPNCWVRVTRTGNSLKMERSIDQTTWTTITTSTVTMAANVTMGLVVTSGSNSILDTDVFSSVTALP